MAEEDDDEMERCANCKRLIDEVESFPDDCDICMEMVCEDCGTQACPNASIDGGCCENLAVGPCCMKACEICGRIYCLQCTQVVEWMDRAEKRMKALRYCDECSDNGKVQAALLVAHEDEAIKRWQTAMGARQ